MRRVIVEKISRKDNEILFLSSLVPGNLNITDLLIDDIDYYKGKRHFMYSNQIYWNYLVKNVKLSQSLILEFKSKLNGRLLCEYQELTEKTIRELLKYKRIEFLDICVNQANNLSEKFIREFKENMFWYYINCSGNLSKEFREEFKEDLASLPF